MPAETKHDSSTQHRTQRDLTSRKCGRLESCSRDPIGYEDGQTLYEYVTGRPIIGVDPTGLIWAGPVVGPLTGPIKDVIDQIEDLIIETGTPGSACNKWFRGLYLATECAAAWCTKSFFNAREPSCDDISDEGGINMGHPATACLETVKHPRIRASIREALKKIEAACNDAVNNSSCCKGGKIIPDTVKPTVGCNINKLPPCTRERVTCIKARLNMRNPTTSAKRRQVLSSALTQ